MLKKENTVLVVIDVQGNLATLMHQQETLFKNVIRMIQAAKALKIPIIWTEQLPDKLGETAPEIKQELSGMNPLIKSTFSCCGDNKFVNKLKEMGRKQVLITGIECHVCVYQTVMDLLTEKFEVHLVQDAVSSRIKENYYLGLEKMKDAGAYLTSVEMSLFEILKVAEGDEFKQIIKIVK